MKHCFAETTTLLEGRSKKRQIYNPQRDVCIIQQSPGRISSIYRTG